MSDDRDSDGRTAVAIAGVCAAIYVVAIFAAGFGLAWALR